MFRLWLLTLLLLGVPAVKPATAALADYEHLYEINLEKDPLPTYEELQQKFRKYNELYNPRYTSVFDLGAIFDPEFRTTIKTYGANEKQLRWEEEDQILEMLAVIPSSWFEYIGPMLHQVPTLSGRILEMPGIKETKNRLPSRISEQVKDVKDLEFLSPGLYFLLMPEIWPGFEIETEQPKLRPTLAKVAYDTAFYDAIKKLVPPEKYQAGVSPNTKISRSDFFTINPTPDSLLTATDIAAVTATLPAVQDWANSTDNRMQLSMVTSMLYSVDFYAEDGKKLWAPALKDMISPCSRLVQKAQILGKERELAMLVAPQGFSLYEWAYRCDKTIRAYRVAHVSSSLMQTLRLYKSGYYDEELSRLTPRSREARYQAMQAVLDMYKAPLADVMEMRKHKKMLHDELAKYDFELAGTAVGRLD